MGVARRVRGQAVWSSSPCFRPPARTPGLSCLLTLGPLSGDDLKNVVSPVPTTIGLMLSSHQLAHPLLWLQSHQPKPSLSQGYAVLTGGIWGLPGPGSSVLVCFKPQSCQHPRRPILLSHDQVPGLWSTAPAPPQASLQEGGRAEPVPLEMVALCPQQCQMPLC